MPHDRQVLESALLTTRWQRGDRSAFKDLVTLWEQPLFYYLRRIAPSEADAWDILQETWIKIFRSLASLRDPYTLPAFLYTTARNTAISRLRLKELKTMDTPALAEDRQYLANEFTALENAEHVHHALDQLPLRQREALTLFFLKDLTLEEMAAVLAIPLGSVKSRLHYAKIALRKILTQGDAHDP